VTSVVWNLSLCKWQSTDGAYFTGHCSHCDLPNAKRAERKRVWMTESKRRPSSSFLPLTSQGSPHLRYAICKAKYLTRATLLNQVIPVLLSSGVVTVLWRRYPITFLDLVGAIYIRSLDPNFISFYIGEADAGCCVVALFVYSLFLIDSGHPLWSVFTIRTNGLRASSIPENGVDGISSGVPSPSRRTQPRSESYRRVKGPE
jgi:hypothetical protein